ncbi:MAG TPA: hypothetical protein VLN45_01840, partial [Ignavibacteriaceae bacterium]|nr:hypothetical protein [Ignavibacteriaceae bacterium]
MLNYVWMTLLFLGIITAVSTDLINNGKNKYRNNESLPVKIEFSEPFIKDSVKSYDVKLFVEREKFNSFYGVNIEKDFILPAKLSINPKENKKVFFFKTNEETPEIWKEIASASGKDDDINASITSLSFSSESNASAKLILEDASFLKMKEVTNSAMDYAMTAV